MKRWMGAMCLIGLSVVSHAQGFLNGQAIPDSCQHLAVGLPMRKGGFEVRVNASGVPASNKNRLSNAAGTPLLFKSMLEAFDYLDEIGWEYLDSFTNTAPGTSAVSGYLFRRKRPIPNP